MKTFICKICEEKLSSQERMFPDEDLCVGCHKPLPVSLALKLLPLVCATLATNPDIFIKKYD